MRLYTIPTNRICLENAVSYLKEIDYVSKKYNESFLYFVLESGCGNVQNQNQKLFKEWNSSHPDQVIYYLTMQAQEKWIKSILKNYSQKERERLFDILLYDKGHICYGSILNRTFLIAASLNVKSIHRRDSDTMLDNSNVFSYPLEYEVSELGKVYKNKIMLVGSSYFGEWAADFEAIYKKDANLLYRHVALNYPKRPMSEIITLAEKRYCKSEVILEKKFVQDRLVELGNCSFKDIYYKFPVCPAVEMMATDYFIHDILFSCNNDILYHPSKVQHHHTSERQNSKWFISYNFRCARYKTYNLLMSRVFEKIKKESMGNVNYIDSLNSKVLAAHIIDLNNSFDIRKEGRILLNELANIFIESEIEEYVYVASEIKNNVELLIDDVEKAIDDLIFLLENWEKLIFNAKENRYEINFI